LQAEGGPDPRPVTESLDRLTRDLGGPDAAALAALFSNWPDIVGPSVAAHARPLSLRSGTLVIGVDQPAWRTQLTYLQAELLQRIDEVAGPGSVRAIEVRVRRS
jgi:predicted nucleic acid-binding Zn ribbon protein